MTDVEIMGAFILAIFIVGALCLMATFIVCTVQYIKNKNNKP